MEHNVRTWFKTTKAIYSSVLLTSISAMVAGILSGITYEFQPDNLTVTGSLGTNLFTIFLWVAQLLFIAGLLLYFMNLGNMRELSTGKDTAAIGQIRVGLAIVMLSAVILLFHIPQWRGSVWISAILDIVAYVIIMVGFNTLRKSEVMSAKARDGFRLIFISMTAFVLSAILILLFSWIPYAGIVFSVIGTALSIAGFIMLINGWSKVKNAMPPVK